MDDRHKERVPKCLDISVFTLTQTDLPRPQMTPTPTKKPTLSAKKSNVVVTDELDRPREARKVEFSGRPSEVSDSSRPDIQRQQKVDIKPLDSSRIVDSNQNLLRNPYQTRVNVVDDKKSDASRTRDSIRSAQRKQDDQQTQRAHGEIPLTDNKSGQNLNRIFKNIVDSTKYKKPDETSYKKSDQSFGAVTEVTQAMKEQQLEELEQTDTIHKQGIVSNLSEAVKYERRKQINPFIEDQRQEELIKTPQFFGKVPPPKVFRDQHPLDEIIELASQDPSHQGENIFSQVELARNLIKQQESRANKNQPVYSQVAEAMIQQKREEKSRINQEALISDAKYAQHEIEQQRSGPIRKPYSMNKDTEIIKPVKDNNFSNRCADILYNLRDHLALQRSRITNPSLFDEMTKICAQIVKSEIVKNMPDYKIVVQVFHTNEYKRHAHSSCCLMDEEYDFRAYQAFGFRDANINEHLVVYVYGLKMMELR